AQLNVSGRLQGLPQPLHVTRGHVSYAHRQLAATDLQVTAGSVAGLVDLLWKADALHVKRLLVKDAYSNASLGLVLNAQELEVSFAGTLTKDTVEAVVGDSHWL